MYYANSNDNMNTVISKVQKRSNKSRRIVCEVGDKLKVVTIIGEQILVETKNNKRFYVTKNEIE